MSYIHLNKILEISDGTTTKSPAESFKQAVEEGVEHNKLSNAVRLPQLIVDKSSISIVPFQVSRPNYIGNQKVIGEIINLENNANKNIDNKIILIENADPGFDWIFSYPIAGFITAWGGVNSHMAIRAGEQEVPAVIGAGEVLFRQWSSCKCLMLDCAEKRVKILQ